MSCETLQEQLGGYVDGELGPDARATVTAHVAACPSCRRELDAIQALAHQLAEPSHSEVPENLWTAIEQQLDAAGTSTHRSPAARSNRVPLRIAAMIALVVGVGSMVVWSDRSANKVEASTISFQVILDTLPLDAEEAFRKFLVLYKAEEIRPSDPKRFAPELNFEAPPTLPGGFRRRALYALHFGNAASVAARYDRPGEFLIAVFHATVFEEDFGTHKDYPCIAGKRCGQKVVSGDWKLVHVTDPTTCHCVLSRLDETTELPAVLSAVAPDSNGSTQHPCGTEHDVHSTGN